MYAYAAMNLACIFCLAISAMATAFTLPPWVPTLLSAAIYVPLISHIFMSAADSGGDYKVPILSLWQVLTWIVLVFAVIYWRSGLLVSGILTNVSFMDAFYFSVGTWTTMVFGDFAPPENMRLVASAECLLGYVGLGLYLAVIGEWIFQRTTLRKNIHDRNRSFKRSAKRLTRAQIRNHRVRKFGLSEVNNRVVPHARKKQKPDTLL